MYLDASLIFSDAQAITVTAASSNYVDTLAAGDAYVGAWLAILVTTTFTAVGSATLTIDLQTDTVSTFVSATTLVSFGTIAKATLVATSTLPYAGYWAKVRIPPGAKRYLRLNYTVASGPFTAGAMDAFVAKDVDLPIT